MRIKTILLLIFGWLASTPGSGQGEFSNWYFGNQAGITFNAAIAVPVTNGAMVAGEGIASISDPSGNLLFYTDGISIWNRNHNVMSNGSGLLGDASTTQGALIVPMPGKPSLYYVFTLTDESQSGKLSYSIVDMTLNAGLGNVLAGSKNLFLGDGLTEKLVSATASSCGIWVLSHFRNNNAFVSWLITPSGMQPPVFSSVGSSHGYGVGTMKVSRDNKKVAVTVITGIMQVFDFDASTGIFSNPVSIFITPGASPYSAILSPDKSKLYTTEAAPDGYLVYQYDMLAGSQNDVNASKTLVGNATSNLPFADLQLGQDNRLYLSRTGKAELAIIPNPDMKAPLCGFTAEAFWLQGKTSWLCLPNDVRVQNNVLDFSLGPDTTGCPGGAITLYAPPATASILWSNGLTTPSISVNAGGIYWLELNDGLCTASDTIIVQFTGKQVQLGPDTAICTGNSFVIQPGSFVSYQWYDNSSQPSLSVNTPGLYWVQATDDCGVTSRDSIVIAERKLVIDDAPDRVRCNSDTVLLHSPGNYLSYAWSPDYQINDPAAPSVIVTPQVDTSYFVKVEVEPGCFATDTIHVKVRQSQPVFLGNDSLICPGTPLILNAGSGFSTYQWSNGSNMPQTEAGAPGTYWVNVSDANGCRNHDSIIIGWKDCPQSLWIPEAFTPNGDGRNDLFKVHYRGAFLKFQIHIYNRWGELVYASADPASTWDGKVRDKKSATGAYVWTCSYQFQNDIPRMMKGMVTVIR